jgi:hypothetical protein
LDGESSWGNNRNERKSPSNRVKNVLFDRLNGRLYHEMIATTAREGAAVQSSKVTKSQALWMTPKSEFTPRIVIDFVLTVFHNNCTYAVPIAADRRALIEKARAVPARKNHCC